MALRQAAMTAVHWVDDSDVNWAAQTAVRWADTMAANLVLRQVAMTAVR